MQDPDKRLWAFVCISSAAELFTKEEVTKLLDDMRLENLSENLTGVLFYSNGNMLMLIEGEKNAVLSQYKFVQQLQQHHSVLKIVDKAIVQRYFEDYPLAFKPVNSDELKPLDDFSSPEKMEYLEECLGMNDPLMMLLRNFLKNNT
jgi:hypothetical protein